MPRSQSIFLTVLVFVTSLGAFAGTQFKATTTLTAQTSNNTSAANTFVTQTNGNTGAANVSKMPTRSLLYPGSTARIYAHFLPWFGFGDHMNVGYASNDPAQVQRQVVDMISRGIDGIIINWYGQGTLTHKFSYYDQATQDLMHEAELHPNFNFAIMDDAGSLKACANTVGCDITQTLINDLTYAYNTYENSPAYMYYNGRPVVYFFGQEAYTLDWTRVRASVPGNPLFIFRNGGGFSYAQSNGAFEWVAPETVTATDPLALIYLDNFDKTALSWSTAYSNTSAYKGFNDSLALWGTGRLIQQGCGQTWLTTLAESGRYYSATRQMLGIQLVTWNDYEEGTEMESGIDNCVTVSASVTGTVATWTITGQANTIDHYTVYVSQDGENLMWLADYPTSTTSIDLAPFQLNSGNYILYVQAIGQPSMTNKISAGVSLAIANQPPLVVLNVSPGSGVAPLTITASTAGSTDPDGNIVSTVISFGDGSPTVSGITTTHTYTTAGTYNVTATVTDNLGKSTTKTASISVSAHAFSFTGGNSSATVTAGQTASYSLSLDTRSSGFVGVVSVVCTGVPAGTTCAVSPASVSFSSSTVSVPLQVTVSTTEQARFAPNRLRGFSLLFATVLGGMFCGVHKRTRQLVLATLAMFVLSSLISCAGGGSSTMQVTKPSSPTNATLTITGNSGNQSASTTLNLTITH